MSRRMLHGVVFGMAAAFAVAAQPPSAHAGRWHELSVGGHRIYFRDSDSAYALAVSAALADLNAVDRRYGFVKPDATSWVLHDDAEFFNGAAFSPLNHIELWGTTADFDTRGFWPWVPNVVTHEYAHLASIDLVRRYPRWLGGLLLGGVEDEFGGSEALKVGASAFVPDNRAPRWFKEGIAQYEAELLGHDGFDTTRRMLERAAYLEDRSLTWEEMATVVGKSSITAELVYNQGYSLTRYLGERFGPESLVRLSRIDGKNALRSFDDSLERTYDMPATALVAAWRDAVAERVAADLARLPLTPSTHTTTPWWQEGPFVRHPVLAPDGTHVAFVADGEVDFPSNQLVSAPLHAPGDQTTLLAGAVDRAAWHPSGVTVYAAVERDLGREDRSTYDLRAVDADGGNARWLTRGARVRWPAVHPSGATLAVAQRGPGSWDLARLPPAGGAVSRVTHLPWGWQLRELVYGDDGTLYGVLARNGELDIFRMPQDDPARMQILDWPGSHEQAPTPDPDGRLWFSGDRFGSWQLFALDATTATAHLMTALPSGALAAAPLSDAALVTVFHSRGWRIDRMALDGDGLPAAPAALTAVAPLAATWTALVLPDASQQPIPHFARARLRPGPIVVYPEFQYQFGRPAGGAVVALADERLHHQLQIGGVFGRFIDVGADYTYSGLPPTLRASATRFRSINPVSLGPGSGPAYGMPFVWDDLTAQALYDPADHWLIGTTLGATRINFNDDIDFFGVGGPWTRLRRVDAGVLAQWADIEPRARRDIDLRGKIAFASATVARSRTANLDFDNGGNPILARDTTPHARLFANGTWAAGRGPYTFEASLTLGWIDRNVDPLDEFFAGGTVFSVRRGEFRSFTNMPGYDEFAISGEKLGLLRLAQRFTLWTDIGAAGPLLFDALVVETGVEAGNAWSHATNGGDILRGIFGRNHFADGLRPDEALITALRRVPGSEGAFPGNDPRFVGLLYDAYMDIRLKAIMFDAFPWNSFLRVAHGFQDREIDLARLPTEQALVRSNVDVRFYLGLGTGF